MTSKLLRLWSTRATLIAECDKMSDRLAEFQIQIEVAAEALAQKDAELFEFIERLHNTMGGLTRPTCESDALDRLRVIRAQADKYVVIRDALAGRIDPDAMLIRNLACAMGTAELNAVAIIARAQTLVKTNHLNTQLVQEVKSLQRQLDDDPLEPV